MESDDGMITKINEGKYDDLIDGKYEKTVYVKTWNDKTIIAKISSQQMVDSLMKQIEAKTKF